jgi:hypothetical protein
MDMVEQAFRPRAFSDPTLPGGGEYFPASRIEMLDRRMANAAAGAG